jgi:glycosyltransferase involved in cell wall biosynthesis
LNKPLFSIVIPTYRRPEPLARCLEAVAGLDYPQDRFEVVVVDDGSGTDLDGIAAPWRDRLQLTTLSNVHAGPSAARNFGAAHARGEYLVFLDDDCLPPRDWLWTFEARVRQYPDAMIGGRLVNVLENSFAVATDLLVTHIFRRWNADPEHAQFLVSANLAFKAEHFREMGGFSEAFAVPGAEDRAICAWWIARGGQIVFAPEVVVHHEHPMSLKKYYRQHFNYGRGASMLHKLRTVGLPNDGKVEGLAWYLDLFTLPIAEGHRLRAPLLASLLFLAQVASIAGFFSDRLQEPRTPSVAATLAPQPSAGDRALG